MAIGAGTHLTWVATNATTQTVTLPAHAAGNLLVVIAACKAATMTSLDVTVTTPASGWTRFGNFADGTTTTGNGTGSVRQAVFYKVAASGAETNPVITWGGAQTAAPGLAGTLQFTKGAGESWETPVVVSAATTNATSISVTMGSNPGITVGDFGIVTHTTRDDSALTVPTWTATGTTLGGVTIPGSIASATSNDMAATFAFRAVTAGTASAAPVCTGTQAAAETGVTSFIRLRVAATVTPVVSQSRFRFRNDDGDETTATWKAAENTNISLAPDTLFRLRIGLQESAGGAWDGGDGPELKYSKNGGSFTSVGFGPLTEVTVAASANVTNEEVTTKQLSGTGTFESGEIDEDNAYVGGTSSNLPASGNTEHEFCLMIVGTGVTAGDEIEFQLEEQFGAIAGWSAVPLLTVAAAGGGDQGFPYIGGGYYG